MIFLLGRTINLKICACPNIMNDLGIRRMIVDIYFMIAFWNIEIELIGGGISNVIICFIHKNRNDILGIGNVIHLNQC